MQKELEKSNAKFLSILLKDVSRKLFAQIFFTNDVKNFKLI